MGGNYSDNHDLGNSWKVAYPLQSVDIKGLCGIW